jgi:hypothetical protein
MVCGLAGGGHRGARGGGRRGGRRQRQERIEHLEQLLQRRLRRRVEQVRDRAQEAGLRTPVRRTLRLFSLPFRVPTATALPSRWTNFLILYVPVNCLPLFVRPVTGTVFANDSASCAAAEADAADEQQRAGGRGRGDGRVEAPDGTLPLPKDG